MTALLNLIYCFLLDMILSFADVWKGGWDSVLAVADRLLASIGTGSLVRPSFRFNTLGCSAPRG